MKENKYMNLFSVLLIIGLVLSNLLNIIWTIHLCLEQFSTGFGYGTNMEIGVLYPWICEIICLPVVIGAIVYLIFAFLKKAKNPLLMANAFLFATLILQYALTNLFIWY